MTTEHRGREAWKHLEKIIYRGFDRSLVFRDWLELMLAAHLSATDNLSRKSLGELKEGKLDGRYEERYLRIIERYKDDRPRGERNADLFVNAAGAIWKDTLESQADVLGVLYMEEITHGDHGQFFTPSEICRVMSEIVEPNPGETVMDPSCGSGTTLIEAARKTRGLILHGVDIDQRCAQMCVLNFLMLGLTGTVVWGDSLAGKYWREWTTSAWGIWEKDLPPETEKEPVSERAALPAPPPAIETREQPALF